ncbi:beta-ketoacyl-ACP synthase II [Ferrovibrio sp.]|uniref:beta-ketoacyl-ACP synthase II n=1 Tax=Ferrovibrio sp. TaxID=1917215 RepID=UPI001B667803|nr:beta-ketoacyl-ACP synthase II [Ferrovibrio sp.]MBP7063342.1 beta-ketoacyl-ACP synthase II [Ferrovibrio sp.]
MRNVVVTGLGLVTPLGQGVGANWRRLLQGLSGIRRISRFRTDDLAARIAGQVPDRSIDPEAGFDPDSAAPAKDRRKMDSFIHYALAAANEALAQAGWQPGDERARERAGCIVATGIGGFPAIAEATRTLDAAGPRKLSPFVIPSFLGNLAAGQISIRWGLEGPLGCPVTACAAGAQAIGDAARAIQRGEVDVMLAGGAEACIERVSLAGFGAARALSTAHNDAPELASRPFDAARDGFVMGEGAGILVLEAEDHARARGADILARFSGYGTSADAHHITAPPEDGRGAILAMRKALAEAKLSPDAIGYINAHSTSTPVGDAAEIAAVRGVFGNGIAQLAMSSTKSAIGHLLGAAGAVEAIYTILALRDQVAPPTLNLEQVDPACAGPDLVPLVAQARHFGHAMSNAFGFGGVNAALIFSRA